MTTRKVGKASKRRLVTFGTISFILIGYFFFSLGTYVISIGKLSNEQKQLEDKLSLLQSNEQNLKIEIQKLRDPEYVARYARENYLYSKDGEYIIKIESNNKTEADNKTNLQSIDYKWIAGTGILIALIIIFIIKKKTTKK
jgi:cell division protein FtsB